MYSNTNLIQLVTFYRQDPATRLYLCN